MTDSDRAEFEAWMVETGPRFNTTERKPDGRYWSSHTHLMWQAWQAARRGPIAPVLQERLRVNPKADPVPQGWTDDQMISFAWMILLNGGSHVDSIEQRLGKFRGLEALRGNSVPAAPQPPKEPK